MSSYDTINHRKGGSGIKEELPLVNKEDRSDGAKGGRRQHTIFHYLIYATINVVIAIPGLYSFVSLIFNHPVFQPHVAALSKLVVFSSFVHQLGFTLFSNLVIGHGILAGKYLVEYCDSLK